MIYLTRLKGTHPAEGAGIRFALYQGGGGSPPAQLS